MKQGAPHSTEGWVTTTTLAARLSGSADEPAYEGAVLTAWGGLLPIQTPARYTSTTLDCALRFEVYPLAVR